MIYANQAGTSWPKPATVRAAVQDALAAPIDEWPDRFESQHAEVASAFGVADPARLLLTPGATTALSVALLDFPWQAGDRLLISGLEHHALHRPAAQLVARGVALTAIPPGDGEPVALDALRAELARGGVRLVAMTAASNVTGDRLPVREIVSLAHEFEAMVLIDAAQLAGWLPLDVRELGPDLLAFTGHKGPHGPWGIGGLYVAEHVTMASPAASCELPTAESQPCAPMPGYCDVGSVDRAALAGLVAGLRWLAEPAQSDRLERAQGQALALCDELDDLESVTVHGFTPASSRLPFVAFTSSARGVGEIEAALYDRGIVVAAGTQCAPLAHETLGTAPGGVVRISFGPGNAGGDERVVANAVREILAG